MILTIGLTRSESIVIVSVSLGISSSLLSLTSLVQGIGAAVESKEPLIVDQQSERGESFASNIQVEVVPVLHAPNHAILTKRCQDCSSKTYEPPSSASPTP